MSTPTPPNKKVSPTQTRCGWCWKTIFPATTKRVHPPAFSNGVYFCDSTCLSRYDAKDTSIQPPPTYTPTPMEDEDEFPIQPRVDRRAVAMKPRCAACYCVLSSEVVAREETWCETCAPKVTQEDEICLVEEERDGYATILSHTEARVRKLERHVRAHRSLMTVLHLFLKDRDATEAKLYRAIARVQKLPPLFIKSRPAPVKKETP